MGEEKPDECFLISALKRETALAKFSKPGGDDPVGVHFVHLRKMRGEDPDVIR